MSLNELFKRIVANLPYLEDKERNHPGFALAWLKEEQASIDGAPTKLTPAVIETPDDLLKFHQSCCAAGAELIRVKNHDYAGYAAQGLKPDVMANFRDDEEYGILVRASDKLKRLKNFVKSGKLLVAGESVEDTGIDLMNYAILFLAYRREARTIRERNKTVALPELVIREPRWFGKMNDLPEDYKRQHARWAVNGFNDDLSRCSCFYLEHGRCTRANAHNERGNSLGDVHHFADGTALIPPSRETAR